MVRYLMWHCPGCDGGHGVPIDGPRAWSYSEGPTLAPSVLMRTPYPDGTRVCHLYLRAGEVEYLSDCTHSLAGTRVPIGEWSIREVDEQQAGGVP